MEQILLIRGINVGGHGRLPMAALRAILVDLGAGLVRTYLQSGNAVCETAIDPQALADRIEAEYGFRRPILAISAPDWTGRIRTNPFPMGIGKMLHGIFHDGAPLDVTAMRNLCDENEQISAQNGVLWLYTPDGFGRSKLAAKIDALADRPVTARNWNSIAAITDLLSND